MSGFLKLLGACATGLGFILLPVHLVLWLRTGQPVAMDVISVAVNNFDARGWFVDPRSWYGAYKMLALTHVSAALLVAGFFLWWAGKFVGLLEPIEKAK